MEQIKKIAKQDILTREYNRHFERKTMLELQIALQRKLDPEEMSAKKPLRFGNDGRPISYTEIKRKEHIEILEGELDDTKMVLETISDLEE